MMPDFFALPRPARLTETFTLTADGRSVTVTLRAMDLLDMHRMVTLRDRMVERYVPFEFRRSAPEEDSSPPVDFPPVGGEPITLSEETCEACATLVVMQPEVTFGFDQLVACLVTCPNLFEQLSRRAAALNRASAGKAERASMASSSASHSPED
ncbi:MAG: hypothetical protein ACYC96_15250 [Fimbriimonadaceae bacterium]